MNADEVVEIVFVNPTENGKAKDCDCQMRVSDGHGQYSDVYYITPCKKHLSGVLVPQPKRPVEGDMQAYLNGKWIPAPIPYYEPKRPVSVERIEEIIYKIDCATNHKEIAEAIFAEINETPNPS